MVKATQEVLEERIEMLWKAHDENRKKIDDMQERLAKYDKLAAKWGGVCMFAAALGTIVMTWGDKILAVLRDAK